MNRTPPSDELAPAARRAARPRPGPRSCRPSRSRPSGRTSSGCGATRSTRCARTSRASRRPSPTRSSPATRGRGDVVLDPFSGRGTTAAPGRRRGPDRRRQRPQPVRPSADGRQGRAGDARRGANPRSRRFASPGRPTSERWLALAERVAETRSPRRLVPAAGSGAAAAAGSEPVPARGRARIPPPDARPAPPRPDDRSTSPRPTDRFLAAALTGILHGKSASYLSEIMPNTFSMAPRYVRDFAARTAFSSPERDVVRLSRAQARPALPPGGAADARASRSSATPATSRPGRGRRCATAACPIGRGSWSTSPPYLRVVKYGYYNWLRTWLLGFDARAIDATLDDAHHREPYLAFLRDVLAGLRTTLTDDAVVVLVIGDVEFDRGRPIAGGRGPRRAGLGDRRRAGGLPARRHRPRRRRRPPQDDQALGRRGRPGDEDRPDPRPRARPRRAAAERLPGPGRRSTGSGRRAGCALSESSGGVRGHHPGPSPELAGTAPPERRRRTPGAACLPM